MYQWCSHETEKRHGAGKGNWGNEADDITAYATSPAAACSPCMTGDTCKTALDRLLRQLAHALPHPRLHPMSCIRWASQRCLAAPALLKPPVWGLRGACCISAELVAQLHSFGLDRHRPPLLQHTWPITNALHARAELASLLLRPPQRLRHLLQRLQARQEVLTGMRQTLLPLSPRLPRRARRRQLPSSPLSLPSLLLLLRRTRCEPCNGHDISAWHKAQHVPRTTQGRTAKHERSHRQVDNGQALGRQLGAVTLRCACWACGTRLAALLLNRALDMIWALLVIMPWLMGTAWAIHHAAMPAHTPHTGTSAARSQQTSCCLDPDCAPNARQEHCQSESVS